MSVSLDKSLGPRKYRVRISKGGVAVTAGSPRIAAQAFYHLEDLMNLRRAPFLKCGEETREHLFSPRMTHSAWGLDEFPEGHLRQIAHAGIDAIVVFIRDVHSRVNIGMRTLIKRLFPIFTVILFLDIMT